MRYSLPARTASGGAAAAGRSNKINMFMRAPNSYISFFITDRLVLYYNYVWWTAMMRSRMEHA